MEPLDLKKFIWINKETKTSYIILAITDFKEHDVVVFRDVHNMNSIQMKTVDEFCKLHEATYDISHNRS